MSASPHAGADATWLPAREPSRSPRWARPVARLVGWDETPSARLTAARPFSMRWPACLGLNAALGLALASVAANASRTGNPYAVEGLYLAVALIFLPFAFRALRPGVPGAEHVANLAILTLALYLVRLIREPIGFLDHDEFLHWSTASGILETGSLFGPNALLPVSPLYPGLELVGTALASLSGLPLFEASVGFLAVARVTFVVTMYLVYERISGNARVAACATLVYMGASTFLVFDSQFSYESLAVSFLAAALLADARSGTEGRIRHALFVLLPLLAALAMTHHMTAFFTAALLCGVAILECLRVGPRRLPGTAVAVAVASVLLPLGWSRLMGDPTGGYLGPVIVGGLREAAQLLTFQSGRTLFVSDDGTVAPLWQRLVAVASVGLVCLGLLAGFLRALGQAGIPVAWRTLASPARLLSWHNSRLVLLAGLTLAFPLSVMFRFTRSGWEIGNRLGPLSFFGVGLVVAVGVAAYWQGHSRGRLRTLAIASAMLCVLVGGIISAQGPRILVPAHFQVSADSASIEPMGISAAEWTREWLGPRNAFASDRINRLLLATYGRQLVSTTLQDGVDTGVAILSPTLGDKVTDVLREGRIDYVSVDLRMTTGLPVVGVYFDGGEADKTHGAPPRGEALMKFNNATDVGRVFDDGYIVTYDVRAIDAAR